MGLSSLFPSEFGDELLLPIVAHIPPEDNLRSVQLVCRRFRKVATDQTIWKEHCHISFRYWQKEHRFKEKIRTKAANVDWRSLWLMRKRRNTRIKAIFERILVTKVGRLERIEEIAQFGYDAKDYLLAESQTGDDAEDVLARRYYSMMILDSIHRSMAVEVWSKLQDRPEDHPELDQAFGAFDMFVLHDQPQDLDYINSSLDELADSFRKDQQVPDHMPTRAKALALVRWLRRQGFTGMKTDSQTEYRSLRKCMIGHALSGPDHTSLPIVSSAIYCSVARRLGIDVACCNAPNHVHTVVSAPRGEDLDGNQREDDEQDKMYIDPYESDQEVRIEDLEQRRAALTVAPGLRHPIGSFLRGVPVQDLVKRMASNIRLSYDVIKRLAADDEAAEMQKLRAGNGDQNLEACMYAALWADLLATPLNSLAAGGWDQLDVFLNRFALQWSEDAWIVEKYLAPIYDRYVALRRAQGEQNRVGWENVREILKMLRNLDARRPTLSRRYTQEIHERVLYRIGQVFRHRRYGYIGVINGWAASGLSSLPKPHYVPTDESETESGEASPGGSFEPDGRRRGRTYYTCLRPNCDRLRLSQENIEIITDPNLIPEWLFFLAGKFFKRFDRDTCSFVSNIKEFYPDD